MTEDEARRKWCPFARVPDGGNVPGAVTATNRHAGRKTGADGKPRILRGNAMCIASECMAWRWTSVQGGICGLAGPVIHSGRANPVPPCPPPPPQTGRGV